MSYTSCGNELKNLLFLLRGVNDFILAHTHGIQNDAGFPVMVESLMSELQKSTSMLRSIQNALVPISSLPIELLTRIFRYASMQRLNNGVYRRSTMGKIAKVCRAWRDFAYNSSFLWSTITNVTRDTEAHRFLDLCGSLPLELYLLTSRRSVVLASEESCSIPVAYRVANQEHCIDHDLFRRLSKCSPRIDRLHLFEAKGSKSNFACTIDAFKFQMPTLRTFSLTIPSISRFRRWDPPDSLFGSFAPALRRVYIQCAVSVLPDVISRNLTHLRLGNTTLDAEGILNCLSHNPHLEVFILRSVNGSPPGEVPDSRTSVVLPSMKSCSIVFDHVEGARAIFGRLDIPPSAQCQMWCTQRLGNPGAEVRSEEHFLDYPMSAFALNRTHCRQGWLTKTHLFLTVIQGRHEHVRTGVVDYAGALQVVINDDTPSEPTDNFLVAPDGYAPDMTTLTLSIDSRDKSPLHFLPANFLQSIGQAAPNIECLQLCAYDNRPTIKLLMSASASNKLLFPNLRTICAFQHDVLHAKIIRSLIKFIKHRKHIGLPLQELRLMCCPFDGAEFDFPPADTDELKASVPQFQLRCRFQGQDGYIDQINIGQWPPPGRYSMEDGYIDFEAAEDTNSMMLNWNYAWDNATIVESMGI